MVLLVYSTYILYICIDLEIACITHHVSSLRSNFRICRYLLNMCVNYYYNAISVTQLLRTAPPHTYIIGVKNKFERKFIYTLMTSANEHTLSHTEKLVSLKMTYTYV